jgi:microcystin-dependent protein
MSKILGKHSSGTVGKVIHLAGSTAPTGTLVCDGRLVSRTTYAALFSVIGTAHGSGDGSTTFNLPDHRGIFLRGNINIPNVTGTGTAASNNATFTSHGYKRSGVKVRLASGTLSGLATATDYWTIYVDDNTLAFATSYANAIAGTKIAISGANSGVIQQWVDPEASSRTAPVSGGSTTTGVGSVQLDAYQGHKHTSTSLIDTNSLNQGAFSGAGVDGRTTLQNLMDGGYTTDGTNGVPRSGQETRPANATVLICICYQ